MTSQPRAGWKGALANGIVAGLAVAVSSLAELIYLQHKGAALSLTLVLLATLALAFLCASLCVLASFAGRAKHMLQVLVLAAGLWPFVQHGTSLVAWHWFRADAWAFVGIVFSPLVAEGFLRLARSRAVRGGMLLSVPVMLGLGYWQHRALTDAGPKARAGSHPDVIVLVMDTTRRDHLGMYGYKAPTTPHLDALAASAEVFDQAWSTAPWTPPSHASLFTGLLPAEHGVDGQSAPPFQTKATTLPEVLRAAGYRTGAAIANPMLTTRGWERGFDDFLTFWDRSSDTLSGWLNDLRFGTSLPWEMDRSRTARTLGLAKDWWASSADAPRFLFINVLDPHWPYRPSQEFYDRFLPGIDPARAYAVEQAPEPHHVHPGVGPEDRAILAALYDAELASMDQQLGAFFDWLRERGELDQTLLVITSDHGERLGERGLTGHEVMMDSYLLRIPMLVRFPPRVEPRRVDTLVQLDGVPGYVLALLGIDAPEPMRSRAIGAAPLELIVAQDQEPVGFLADILERDPKFNVDRYLGDWSFVSDGRFAWITSTHKGASPVGLFDLASDPELTHDLSDALPDVRTKLAGRAATLPRFTPVTHSEIGPRVLKQLRSLGYAGEH